MPAAGRYIDGIFKLTTYPGPLGLLNQFGDGWIYSVEELKHVAIHFCEDL